MIPVKYYISGLLGVASSAGTLATMSLTDIDPYVRSLAGIVGLLTGLAMLVRFMRDIWRGK